jgi:hypothetical protein
MPVFGCARSKSNGHIRKSGALFIRATSTSAETNDAFTFGVQTPGARSAISTNSAPASSQGDETRHSRDCTQSTARRVLDASREAITTGSHAPQSAGHRSTMRKQIASSLSSPGSIKEIETSRFIAHLTPSTLTEARYPPCHRLRSNAK